MTSSVEAADCNQPNKQSEGAAAAHLIGQVVGLELTVGGVLNEDWLVPDGGRG